MNLLKHRSAELGVSQERHETYLVNLNEVQIDFLWVWHQTPKGPLRRGCKLNILSEAEIRFLLLPLDNEGC